MSYRGGHRGRFNRNRRPYREHHDQEKGSEVINNDSPIVQMFLVYQTELDAKHDKYERLIKKSRDLTIESKRIIFLLHRVSSTTDNTEVLSEAENRLKNLFSDIITDISQELCEREIYQFLRAISSGLQEFVEALTFFYYLKDKRLVSIDEVHNPNILTVSCESGDGQIKTQGVPFSKILPPMEFILGISDLTGELMRKCINSVAAGNIDEPFQLRDVLRNIYEGMLPFSYSRGELRRKFYTLKGSLMKVENACYAIKVRGSEVPKHMLVDFFSNDDDEGFKEDTYEDE